MIIGIDASRSIAPIQKTGVEVISDQLLRTLNSELQTSNHELRYYTPERIGWLPENKQRVISLPRFWTVVRLSIELLFHRPDVFFSPVHELPFFCPRKTYRVLHDVAFLRTPQAYSLLQRLYLRFGLHRTVRVCEKIFVSTEQVKKDLVKLAGVSARQIEVVGFGYERKNTQALTYDTNKRKKQFLFIGRVEAKKNISNLLKAFEQFTKIHPDYALVIAGKPGYGYEMIQRTYAGLSVGVQHKIKFTGYISDQEKNTLLAESTALVHVAFEEGFGIPLLEAFDFGLPVIASDIPVLRETGGTACYYVDPSSPALIAKGMEKIVTGTAGRLRMQQLGFEQLANHSWQEVVRNMKLQ